MVYNRYILSSQISAPKRKGRQMPLSLDSQELALVKEQIAPKIGRAVKILHEGGYGIVIDTYSLGITDPLVIASITADLGSVNPKRVKVKPVGNTIRVVFTPPAGFTDEQATKEAAESFSAIRKKLIHKVAKIKMSEIA